MEWEVRIIEWLQAHLGSFGGLVKLLALLVRCGRYAVIMFLIMGVYLLQGAEYGGG